MNVIVVGGGPAGMIAAITASKKGDNVILLEKMRSVGRKLSITGKGRCNITNATDIDNFIKNVPGNGKFLFSAFNQFNNIDAINFFNSIGVETKVERGDRVFPTSDSALFVIDKLKKELTDIKYDALTRSSELMELSRQSRIEEYIKTRDSQLQIATNPPYLIKD